MAAAVCRRLYMLPAAREIRSHPFLHVVILTAAAAAAKNIASKNDSINAAAAAARAAVASSIASPMSVQSSIPENNCTAHGQGRWQKEAQKEIHLFFVSICKSAAIILRTTSLNTAPSVHQH